MIKLGTIFVQYTTWLSTGLVTCFVQSTYTERVVIFESYVNLHICYELSEWKISKLHVFNWMITKNQTMKVCTFTLVPVTR